MATPKNDSFRVQAQKSLDDKLLRLGRFAYVSRDEAIALVPVAERHPGLQVVVGDQVHAWVQGTTNDDLLPLNIFQKDLPADGIYPLKALNFLQGFATKNMGTSDIMLLRIGKSNGSGEVEMGARIVANSQEWSINMFPYLSSIDQNFFFSGVTQPIRIRIFKL